ncbi:uncharacterized protein H6S33_008306 [Morchella sextelata]|uniref:uncharacterized protein n=1 Tax=Morchella sextelata TaxID=1174677 RepID=UPI001D03ACCB|nr:uncharacterized protein H6S33_008306 [Morchella sextelata]KAH0602656.1 hypothetical protein H6S33_008306 [Morchella sextelata]
MTSREPSPPNESDTPLLNNEMAINIRRMKQAHIDRSTRKRLGILLLSVVIVLWVSSSFLTYAIFSDDSYTKPYFVTYLNTSVFCFYLMPWASRKALARWRNDDAEGWVEGALGRCEYRPVTQDCEQSEDAANAPGRAGKLGIRETMRLSAEFCLMWFIANYFQSYCLKWTSVASSTILSCTSSIFTLILSALLRIERFSWTKLFSVFLSIAGISLISSIDFDSHKESVAGKYDKTPAEIMLGDGMALFGAFSYGVYTTLLKVRVGHESRVSMQMFFGFVGLFNLLGLWPGLLLLHAMGVEKFQLPPDNRVWWIVAINALITLVSDYCWAYAMLLTTPLIVTVGLSLTIPLALLGQMLLHQNSPKFLYWVGAALVLVAFLFINNESETLDAVIESEATGEFTVEHDRID